MDFLTLTSGAAVMLSAVLAFVAKQAYTKLTEALNEQEVRRLIEDRVRPVEDDVSEIKDTVNKIYDHLLSK